MPDFTPAAPSILDTLAVPHTLANDDHDVLALDPYARRGVAIPRDAAHVLIAALRRDAHDLRTRPCQANADAAARQDALAASISSALNRS